MRPPAEARAEVVCDPPGRRGMVAGDHDRPHSCRSGLRDRGPRLRAGRVDDPDEAEVGQVALDRLVGRRVPALRDLAVGDGQRAQREACEAIDRRGNLLLAAAGQGPRLARNPLGRAARQQHVGRAGRDDRDATLELVGLERRHELPLGRERDLSDALEALLPRLRETLDLRLGDEEGGVGRVAVDDPFAVDEVESRVVREAAASDDEADLAEESGGVGERVPVDEQLALGAVAVAGDVHLTRAGRDLLDRHLVLRQRPCLVRADHRRRTERLHRREALDDRPAPGHPLHPEREDDRQDGGQPLRHRRHCERDADQEHVDEVRGLVEVGGHEDRAHDHDRDRDHGGSEHAPDAGDLALQRRALLLRPSEQPRDVPHLGAPCRWPSPPPGHGRA